MSMWAATGVKCECIAPPDFIARKRAENPWANFPDHGGIYTVRGFVDGTDGVVRILLSEVRNDPMPCVVGMVEWGFELKYFRPIIARTQEQDVSLFTHLLDGLPVGETA